MIIDKQLNNLYFDEQRKDLKHNINAFKEFDKLVYETKNTTKTYEQARKFLLTTMQNIIEELKNKGIDTKNLQHSKIEFEKEEELRSKLKNEIIIQANALLREKDKAKITELSNSLADKIALYDPAVSIDYKYNFFSEVMDYIDKDLQKELAEAVAIVKNYQKDENNKGFDLGGGKKLNWIVNFNRVEFKIRDEYQDLVRFRQEMKNLKTLLAMFEQKENKIQDELLKKLLSGI